VTLTTYHHPPALHKVTLTHFTEASNVPPDDRR